MSFTLKNIFIILLIIGFFISLKELIIIINIKRTIAKSINHFKEFRNKIDLGIGDLDEHLLFLNQNCKLINSTSLGELKSAHLPSQSLLEYVLFNYQSMLTQYLKNIISNSLNALFSKAIQVKSEIKIQNYVINLVNPFYWLKKGIRFMVTNFLSLFPFKIHSTLKKTIEIIVDIITALTILITFLEKISPELLKILISMLNL
ncbi:MAG: hypothetical protein ACRC0Y_12790 [Fusobacteriaceae bacterium]